MSHWGRPRLHFAGTFLADPPTLNNRGANYALAASGQPLIEDGATGWNENGSHEFSVRGGKVTAVVDAAGVVRAAPGSDPAVGADVVSVPAPVVAKIVDLDPDAQLVSEIYGLRLRIRDAAGGGFEGTMRPVAFRDLAMGRTLDGGTTGLVASYHSVLEAVKWTGTPTGVLADLRTLSPDRLSVKFAVDRYRSPTTPVGNKKNLQGDVVGAIGPAADVDSLSFPSGRRLEPAFDPKSSIPSLSIGPAFCEIDRASRVLRLDLSGALPRSASIADRMDLEVGYITDDAKLRVFGRVKATLAEFGTSFWTFEIPAAPSDADRRPLVVRHVSSSGTVEILREPDDGRYLEVEPRSLRLDPDQVSDVIVRVRTFGEPAKDVRVACSILGRADGGASEPGLAFPKTVTTDADGRALATLRGGRPGAPRGTALDGDVYKVVFRIDGADPGAPEPSCTIHVRDPFTPAAATWESVEPFLRVYARLFPFMNAKLRLDDKAAMTDAKARLVGPDGLLDLPITHPGFMPVTRDLSAGRLAALRAWLDTV
jgi:hypothetical protein